MIDLSKVIAWARTIKLRNPTTTPVPGSTIEGADNFGAQLAEGFQAVKQQLDTIKQQGNFSTTGQVAAPPALAGFRMSNGPSGEIQFEINDPSEISRGINYSVDLDTSPHFTNPHTIELGQSRNGHVNLPGQTLYGRATSWYTAGQAGPFIYHGGQATPQSVTGGIPGPRSASQGSGTGAPGTGGGPGPVPARSAQCGYNWKAQRPGGSGGGNIGSAVPVSGIAGGAGGGSGGGGGIVSPLILVDTYSNWTSAKYNPVNYPLGSIFVISDHNNVSYQVQLVSSVNAWVYLEGSYSVAQSAVSGIKGYNGTALGTNDTGLLVNVTDYAHVLQWSGSAFGWGPGELGSGYFQDFAVAPTGNGWHACDGSAVHYLTATGALSSGTVTLPNTAGSAAYRKLGASYAASITAAAAPTVTPTGTVSQPTFTGNASGSTNVLNTGGSTAVVPAPFTPTGTVSQPTFTGASDTTVLPGDPVANFQAIQYFRI